MKNLFRSLKIALVVACFCYVSGVAIGSSNTVQADAACVDRGQHSICDCVGDNCGKVCSRSISLNCSGGTCKAKPKEGGEIEDEGGSY